MAVRQRYRLSLVGGPSCGSLLIEPDRADDEPFSWPPQLILRVKGCTDGYYLQSRISDPVLGEVDYHFARYEWVRS